MASSLKGLVLCGGKALRLRPLTYTGAKQLVPIANRPIVFYAIDDLVEAGIREIAVIVSPETGAQVRASIGDGSRWDASISYVEQPVPGGIAQAVGLAREFLADAPFVTFLGDNFLTDGIQRQAQAFESSNADAGILLRRVDDPREFGVAEFDGERLVRVIEKPAHPPSDLAVIGIYFLTKRIFDAIDRIKPSSRGELEIADAIQWLLDAGAYVRADVIEGGWIDTGKHDDLLEANRMILRSLKRDLTVGTVDASSRVEGAVVLQPGCEIVDSVITGPAIIGERTRIERSRIGPCSSIGPDCVVVGSEISSSVIMERTSIVHAGRPIQDSLIGRNVQVRGREQPAYRLVLGDFSRASVP
jgi:glucose-1-phosphate thymidylyltransferase